MKKRGLMRKLLLSRQGFALSMLLGAVLLLITTVICTLTYESDVSHSFGIRSSLVPFVWASFLPVIGASAVGFRTALVNLLGFDDQPLIPITNKIGGVINYLIGATGIVVGLVAIIVISMNRISNENAEKLIAACSTVWAATVGYMFDQFFRQSGEQSNKLAVPQAQPELDKSSSH